MLSRVVQPIEARVCQVCMKFWFGFVRTIFVYFWWRKRGDLRELCAGMLLESSLDPSGGNLCICNMIAWCAYMTLVRASKKYCEF